MTKRKSFSQEFKRETIGRLERSKPSNATPSGTGRLPGPPAPLPIKCLFG